MFSRASLRARKATPDDRLLLRTFRFADPRVPHEREAEQLIHDTWIAQGESDDGHTGVRLAFHELVLVGALRYGWYTDETAAKSRYLALESIGVVRAYRSRGIGRALVAGLLRDGRKDGPFRAFGCVSVYNTASQRFTAGALQCPEPDQPGEYLQYTTYVR